MIVIKKSKLLLAGLIAVLIGFPLARETFAGGVGSWIGLGIDASIAGSEASF